MNKKLFILIGIFFFSLIPRLVTINEIGRTWDEFLYVEQGHKFIQLLQRGDFDNSFFYTTYDHPPLVKLLYGAAAYFDIARYTPTGDAIFYYDLTYTRLLSAIIYSIGVVIVVMLGWRFFSFSIGIIAGIILSLLPFTLGLSQLVTAESFKILIYPLAIYTFILLLKKYSLRNLLFAGIITGIALQIKQSNGLLIPLFCLLLLFYYSQTNNEERRSFIKRTLFSLAAISFISVFVFILLWPQFPFHLQEIYEIHKGLWHVQFTSKPWLITISVPEVFFGRLMLTPNFYYLIYFFITIPLGILLLFFVGIKDIFDKKSWVLYSLLLWFLIPFIMSFYSWRQHGLRYIIEIYPAIALIAAVGFNNLVSKVTKSEIKKIIYFVPVMIYLIITLWQIKPYYLDYFNEVVGGANIVYKYKLFQQGWWGQGIREASLYIKDTAPKNAKIGYAISPEHVLPRFSDYHYEKWAAHKKYDYVIVNHYNLIREEFDDLLIRRNYQLVHEIRADEAILVYIYKSK